MRKILLKHPIDFNIKELASYLPDMNYGGPVEGSQWTKGLTSHRILDPHNNHRIVLSFDGNDGTGFTEVGTDLSNKELAYVLAKLPVAMGDKIQEEFAGTELEIPGLAKEESAAFRRQEFTHALEGLPIWAANSKGQPHRRGNFTSGEARNIPQHGVGYTDATSAKPILGSYGAGPCLIVAVYNPETKTAALSHVDELTLLHSITDIFYQLGKNSKEKLQVHLAGGDESSRNMVTEIINIISHTPNAEIISSDVLNPGGGSKQLAIDARTGEVFTEFKLDQLDTGPNYERGKTALNSAVFEGRKPFALSMVFDDRKEARDSGHAIDRALFIPSGEVIFRGSVRTDPRPRNGSWADNS